MGCTNSKVDELPAVCLCRERCGFLDDAIRQRFELAEAHVAYLHSLKAVGVSLDRFFNQDLPEGGVDGSSSSSPVLNLPPHRKKGEPSDKIHHLHSRSHSDDDSGSHLHFHSDDELEEEPGNDDDGDGSGSGSKAMHHLHGGDAITSSAKPYGGGFLPPDYNLFFPGGRGGGGLMNVNYMKKNQTTPSVVYTQQPMIDPEIMRMTESFSSSFPYNDPYPYSSKNPPYNPEAGFFSSQLDDNVSSASKAPPPPPPSSSDWDFLNPFESFERYYPSYPRSRDSREVREEEGIPDLEDENEVVKEVLGDQKLVDRPKPPDEVNDDAAHLRFRAGPDPVEHEVHMVDKKVVDETIGHAASTSGVKPRAGNRFNGDVDVVREIQREFERASEFGTELAKFLEVEKIPPYKRSKHSGYHVSSKLLRLPLLSSQASASKGSDSSDAALDADQEMELRSKNLSSTLHKLHLWEKKLHEEVKVEEKMRTLHERKSRKLKLLDDKGAEAHKVDATRAFVRSLSTKIKIAIQVVDKISVKINSLRDDELWPQLHEFIRRLTGMWKSMLECNRNQCRAIAEAKRLDTIALRKQFSDAHFEATRQLEHDIIDWALKFSYWVGSQKGYVQSMQRWLMKCLLYIPEETPDGIIPFSPGRIGAPLIFVVCNQWWQSLDRISEKEVVESMRDFALNVLQLWDRDRAEIRQRMLENKEETEAKSLDREEQEMQKRIQALDKTALSNGHIVYQSETSTTKGGGGLQASLRHALDAMERFSANSLKVYEDLLQRIEEEHLG